MVDAMERLSDLGEVSEVTSPELTSQEVSISDYESMREEIEESVEDPHVPGTASVYTTPKPPPPEK